jgi:uncharacterized NAD-dependent epimerase/dehydratase family protein
MVSPEREGRITPDTRLALLMHDNLTGGSGKMGLGLLRYSQAQIVAVVDRRTAGQDLPTLTGIARPAPIVASVAEANQLGADTLLIGVAPPGGVLPPDWYVDLRAALEAGMSLVNGLHLTLATDPELAPLLQPGRFIWDVRREPAGLENGMGRAAGLPARRALTVGTDMAIGKMTASLEMERAARARGLRARFIASGQIGICIAGEGVPLDAVRVDFASGAMEQLVLRYGHDHDLLLVEGQGSILHPASTAWLPLMRGSCPTHLILAHRAGQEHIWRAPELRIPPLREVAALYEAVCAACGLFPPAKVVGIALNTHHLGDREAAEAVARTEAETGLPVTDVVRYGAEPLVDAVMAD